jgi:hypothetical protein
LVINIISIYQNKSLIFIRNLNEAILAYYDAEMPTDKIPRMRFIGDVTVGEGEAIPPNTRFVKTWRVENSGKIFLFRLNI